MTNLVGSLLQHYGYLAIFALVLVESLGLPVPGETALIAGAVYAGTTHRLDIAVIAAVAIAAAVVGDNIGFVLGRRYGPALITRLGRRLRLTPGLVAVTERLFDRHGAVVVAGGRFVSVLRTWAAFLAGVNGMAWRRFLLANATGGIAWAITWSAAGYYLASAAARFGHWATIAGIVVAVVLAAVTARITHRRFARLEAEQAPSEPAAVEVAAAPVP